MKIVRSRRCVCGQRSKSRNINRFDNIRTAARQTPALGNDRRGGRDAYKTATIGVLPLVNVSLLPPTLAVCTNEIPPRHITHRMKLKPTQSPSATDVDMAGIKMRGEAKAQFRIQGGGRELLFQSYPPLLYLQETETGRETKVLYTRLGTSS